MMSKENNNRRQSGKIKAASIIKLLILIIIVVGTPIYIYFFQHQLIDTFSSIVSTKQFLDAHKTGNVFLLTGLQIAQIIISVIPGQWIQFAAGYIYGFLFGLVMSVAGAAIGTVIAYNLARFLGRDAFRSILKQDTLDRYTDLIGSRKGITAVFLIYLIPGIPKDICCYAAGFSDMKLRPFLLVSTLGRIPGMAGSILVGKYTGIGGYRIAVIIAVIAVILFILGLIFRKKLMTALDKMYDKVENME